MAQININNIKFTNIIILYREPYGPGYIIRNHFHKQQPVRGPALAGVGFHNWKTSRRVLLKSSHLRHCRLFRIPVSAKIIAYGYAKNQ